MKISSKLSLVIITVVAVTNFLFSVYFVDHERHFRESQLEKKIEITNKLLLMIYRDLIWNFYIEEIKTQSMAIIQDQDITALLVTDHHGNVLADFQSKDRFPNFEISKILEITSQDSIIAYVNVTYTRAFIEKELNNIIIEIIIFTLIMQLLIVFAIYNSTTIILDPIQKILKGINEIVHGNYRYQLQLNQKNEFQDIERFFNKMVFSIQESNDSYQQLAERYRSLFENSPVSLWEEDFSKIKDYFENLRASGVNDLQNHFESQPNAVAHCAQLVKLQNINKATQDLLGANSKKEVLAGLQSLFTQESMIVFSEELITLFQGSQRFESEVSQKTLTGDEKFVSLKLSVSPGYEDSLGKVLVSMLDITKRKKAEEALKAHQDHLQEMVKDRTSELAIVTQKAEEANKSKSQFLANMSHELRTPLNAIMGFSQILKKQKNLSDTQKIQLNTIYTSGQHLLTLISDILDISRIETGKEILEFDEINLPTLIYEILSIIQVKATKKNLEFRYEHGAKLPAIVRIDGRKLRQILINFLDNAIKYTDEGSVTFRVGPVKSDLSVKKNNGIRMIQFEIEDTGVGIPKEKQGEIFKPFTQVEIEGKKREGTGLGLAISHQLLDLMGGTLRLESETGKGSTFTLEVGMEVVEETSETVIKAPDKTVVDYEGERKKILIVDDNPANVSLLLAFLEPLGFKLETAVNGEKAIKIVEQNRPDLVLMDLLMDGINGHEALRRIRKNESLKNTKIIGISAAVADKPKVNAFAIDCDDFVSKPVEFEKLMPILKEHLKINWIEEELNQTEVYKTTVKPEKRPSQMILDKIVENLEKGDFTRADKILDALMHEDEIYEAFCSRIKNLIKTYDDEAIIRLLTSD